MEVKKLVPELRFKEFDGEFQKKKIGNIAELTSSKRVYLNDYVDIGIPFYRGKEITELRAGKKPDDILYITESSYNEFRSKYGVPQKDDILITAVGTLGNVLRIKNDDKFYFKDGNLIWFRKIQENSNYLEIALEFYKREIDKTSIGSTQRALTMVELRKLIFPFPSLPEQQKIASFLSAVDEKIQQLTKKKELLEHYKKGVMQQLFSGKLRFKDATSTGLSAGNGKDFPEWEEKRLGEIAIKSSSNISANTIEDNFGEYKIYGASGLLKKIDFFREEKPFISIVKDGAGVGRTLLCEENSSVLGTLDIIKPKVKVVLYFLYSVLNNVRFEKYIVGSTIPHIYFKDYSNERITIPCFEEQQKIATYLSSIDTKIESVTQQITQTQTFKKGLLQQMFV